ncbi:MAG TPA: hypothetical protein VJS12_06965 [Steroidobacteraceae bacterium]|nr:hypothetical protein [Steroidobacteraceae bacterium]
MSDPHPLNPVAYFAGTQPLWRGFWLWSVGFSVSVAVGYAGIDGLLFGEGSDRDWARPMIRVLRVWAALGLTSLFIIIRSHRNARSPVAGMAAFAVVGLPTAYCLFMLFWFMS